MDLWFLVVLLVIKGHWHDAFSVDDRGTWHRVQDFYLFESHRRLMLVGLKFYRMLEISQDCYCQNLNEVDWNFSG